MILLFENDDLCRTGLERVPTKRVEAEEACPLCMEVMGEGTDAAALPCCGKLTCATANYNINANFLRFFLLKLQNGWRIAYEK